MSTLIEKKSRYSDYSIGFLELKGNLSIMRLELDIIGDKLQQGINGFEWLVLHNIVDKESLNIGLEVLDIHARILNTDCFTIIKYLLNNTEEAFYLEYELNYWMIADTIVDYMTVLKERSYTEYLNKLDYFYN